MSERSPLTPDGWSVRMTRAIGDPEWTRPLGGRVCRVRAGGRDLVVKTGIGATDESDGLRALGGVSGAPAVPEVVWSEPEVLVTTWVEQAPRTAAHEEALGRQLARLHTAPWPTWGGGSSRIGDCPVRPTVSPRAAPFYRTRLVDLADRCGMTAEVSVVADRLAELLPPGGPALLHGDLWWGNVLWGADGRPWVIDPSVHGGHPEEDLAMLGLFGAVPERLVHAYLEVRPLEAGWEGRADLFALVPLLVHSVLFGGDYRRQVEAVLRRYS